MFLWIPYTTNRLLKKLQWGMYLFMHGNIGSHIKCYMFHVVATLLSYQISKLKNNNSVIVLHLKVLLM